VSGLRRIGGLFKAAPGARRARLAQTGQIVRADLEVQAVAERSSPSLRRDLPDALAGPGMFRLETPRI
jgi:hypothetical protein